MSIISYRVTFVCYTSQYVSSRGTFVRSNVWSLTNDEHGTMEIGTENQRNVTFTLHGRADGSLISVNYSVNEISEANVTRTTAYRVACFTVVLSLQLLVLLLYQRLSEMYFNLRETIFRFSSQFLKS